MQRPFEAKQPSGLKRLMDLLCRTMIRAAKKDLVTIPPLYYKVRKPIIFCCNELFFPGQYVICRVMRGLYSPVCLESEQCYTSLSNAASKAA